MATVGFRSDLLIFLVTLIIIFIVVYDKNYNRDTNNNYSMTCSGVTVLKYLFHHKSSNLMFNLSGTY